MKVRWTFECEISDDEWKEKISESNDVMYLGYTKIQEDHDKADSCDDFNLQFEIL